VRLLSGGGVTRVTH